MTAKQLTIEDFEEAFGDKLSNFVKSKIEEYDFSYVELEQGERDHLLLTILKSLDAPSITRSGPHRINDWERGWGENRDEFEETNKYDSLIPKYFGKFPYVRWQQDFIKPVNKNFEYNMVKVLQYWMFEKYFESCSAVYEFGCGTGHNLMRVCDINPKAQMYGLDWAISSQDGIQKINEACGTNFGYHNFDFFNVDVDYNLEPNSAVYTFAALEQVGDSYRDFVDYLIEQKPEICVHIEPMSDPLDPEENLIDYLSVRYFNKRNYLGNLVSTLKKIESCGKIEIVQLQRSYIGSLFIDGYSIVAWKPTDA